MVYLVQSIFKQGGVTHFIFSASFFSYASIKDLKNVVTMLSVYLPTGSVFEKPTLPELAEWASALWDEERVRPRGSGWSWGAFGLTHICDFTMTEVTKHPFRHQFQSTLGILCFDNTSLYLESQETVYSGNSKIVWQM